MEPTTNAHRAGLAAPDAATSDKARGANAGQVRDQSAAVAPDAIGAAEPGQGKAFAGLQAAAALRGFAVTAIEADGGGREYVISRGALCTRRFSLDALRQLLQRMGAAC